MTNTHLSTILAEPFPIAKVSEKGVFYFPICLIGTQIASPHVKLGYTQRNNAWKLVEQILINTILLTESCNDLKWLLMQVKKKVLKQDSIWTLWRQNSWLQKKYATMKMLKLLNIFLTLVQLSIQTEAAAKESREAWKGSSGRIGKDHREERCGIRDQGWDHSLPQNPDYHVWMQQLDSEEGR